MCLRLLLEGNSIRSIQRITGLHQETILNSLILAGERCERLMNERIKGVAVKDVEADEICSVLPWQQSTVQHAGVTDSQVGDAYTFVAIERNSKLVLAWHLSKSTLRTGKVSKSIRHQKWWTQ